MKIFHESRNSASVYPTVKFQFDNVFADVLPYFTTRRLTFLTAFKHILI